MSPFAPGEGRVKPDPNASNDWVSARVSGRWEGVGESLAAAFSQQSVFYMLKKTPTTMELAGQDIFVVSQPISHQPSMEPATATQPPLLPQGPGHQVPAPHPTRRVPSGKSV